MRSSGSGNREARKMSVPVRALSVHSPKTATSATRGHSVSNAGMGGRHVHIFRPCPNKPDGLHSRLVLRT